MVMQLIQPASWFDIMEITPYRNTSSLAFGGLGLVMCLLLKNDDDKMNDWTNVFLENDVNADKNEFHYLFCASTKPSLDIDSCYECLLDIEEWRSTPENESPKSPSSSARPRCGPGISKILDILEASSCSRTE